MCKSHITVKKYAKLYLELVFYKVVIYILFSITGYSEFTIMGLIDCCVGFLRYVGTGFFCAYLLFYLYIPFLNILIHNISKKQHLLLILLSSYIYIALSTWRNASVTMNYISWFCVLYFISAFIRLYPIPVLENTRITGLSTVLLIVLATVSVILGATSENSKNAFYYVADSNKILAVLVALSAFLFFKNVQIRYSPLLNRIASSTFGVLCIHANSDAMRKWLWVDVLKNTQIYEMSAIVVVSHAVISVITVFCVCTVLDQLRICLLEKPFFKLWDVTALKLKSIKHDQSLT